MTVYKLCFYVPEEHAEAVKNAVFEAGAGRIVAERFAAMAPAWALWARLPLQPLLMFWVWATAVRERS